MTHFSILAMKNGQFLSLLDHLVLTLDQNPWKEINQAALRESGVEFVRRRSGGGTVYHDLGNTNYSIMVPRQTFDRVTNAELVASALNSQEINIPAWVNERHDIVVHGKKIRSAYKIISQRAYHHGTMLISAELGSLGMLLRNTKTSLLTKGVESVRSPVANLVTFSPNVTHEMFVDAVVQAFQAKYYPDESIPFSETTRCIPAEVEAGAKELRDWDWRFGQTPEFTHDMNNTFPWGDVRAHITAKRGLITESLITGLDIPDNALVGLRYSTLEGAEEVLAISYIGPPDRLQDIITWLRLEM
ncbi:Lipoate-protein ligase A [Ceratobasidium theobromae]|uniref:Putative lipoate-protein ligase A n=1 Tax=Ceratobasidium theobromae TaxID=1582974 RepID=A0A5N5QXF0_9AGAM|nr:Lipoate-protein ligase A [Ceratobasidium theobromae]